MKTFESFLDEQANSKKYYKLLHETAEIIVKDDINIEQLFNELGGFNGTWNPFAKMQRSANYHPDNTAKDLTAAQAAIDKVIQSKLATMEQNPQYRGVFEPKVKELQKISQYLKSGMQGDLASKFFDPWQAYAAQQITGQSRHPHDFNPRYQDDEQHSRGGEQPMSRDDVGNIINANRGVPNGQQAETPSQDASQNASPPPNSQTPPPASSAQQTNNSTPPPLPPAAARTTPPPGARTTPPPLPPGARKPIDNGNSIDTTNVDPSNFQWPHEVNPVTQQNMANQPVGDAGVGSVDTTTNFKKLRPRIRKQFTQHNTQESFSEWFKIRSAQDPVE